MTAWAAKDPDAVLDYVYPIPLDEGDAVQSHSLTVVSGSAVIDDENIAGADVTAKISGGTDGETTVFRITWTTTGGRTDDDFITLLVSAHDYVALELTGYMKPLPQHLVARYPAFAEVPIATIQYWLTDAERGVDSSWIEGDYAAGLMALAAHNMAIAGLGSDAASAAMAQLPAGVTSFKSGSFSLNMSEGAAKDRAAGALASTRYGAEYAALLRVNKGGPRVMATGVMPYNPQYRYPQGEA